MRPGCDRPAEVRLSYDTVSCQVWLDPIPELPGPVQEICEFHALRLTVPRGWILCDRRVASPALFVAKAVPTGSAAPAPVVTTVPPAPTTAPTTVPPTPIATPSARPSDAPTLAPAGNAVAKAPSPVVPLTIGAPTPKVGTPQASVTANQVKRRHPNATASELFPDALEVEDSDEDVSADVELAERAPTELLAGAEPPAEVAPSAEPNEVEAPVGTVVDTPAGSAEANPASHEPVEAQVEPEGADATTDEPAKMDKSAPTSPLLARAFAQTGPQRSVLSDDLRVPDQKRPKRSDR